MRKTSAEIPLSYFLASAVIVGFASFMTWDLSHWWRLRDDYSFGYLVPFFAGYVIYDRWPRIHSFLKSTDPDARLPTTGTFTTWVDLYKTRWLLPFLASVGLLCGLLIFLAGALYRAAEGAQLPASFLMTTGFSLLFLSLVFITGKFDLRGEKLSSYYRFRLSLFFLFPALIWIISAPLMGALESKVSLFLLNKVTYVVFFVFDFLNLPLVQEGNVLIMPTGKVGVADACSGIRSLTACLFAGSFLASVFLHVFWKKVGLVFSAMLLAFLTNIIRSLFLTAWAYRHGAESIGGFVHDATGYGVLGLTCLGLICLLPVFNFSFEIKEDVQTEDAT